MYATRILDLRAEPVKDEYVGGEDVVFTGTLEIHDLWTCHWGAGAWTAGERIVIFSGDVEIASGYTGTDGVFRIPTMLPITLGIYAYRAHFPGRDWAAARDPCWSDTILVSIVGVPPPVEYVCPYCGAVFYTPEALEAHIAICPERPKPPIPPEWEKYLIYGVLGLVAVGLVLMAVRR